MKSLGLSVVGGILVVVFGVIFLLASVQRSDASTCLTDPSTYPSEGVNGYKGDQLANAAAIIDAAQQLSLGRDAQIVGIMAAMGESALKNITYGDWETTGFTNPDGSPTTSIGLFQQQEWWGSTQDRMNPTKAATLFFGRLVALDGWQAMEPSHVIWRVQINTDKNYYAKYEKDAAAIVDALSGSCKAGEWIVPARGIVGDGFGVCGGIRPGRCHMGIDISDGTCNGPIWAAGPGVVSSINYNPTGGYFIFVDHGDGISTGYFHMYKDGIMAKKGDHVDAGTQIGRVGNNGNSYGCHLHFEVRKNGHSIDPEPFMISKGATLPRR